MERFSIEHAGRIHARRVPPSSAGWEENLYRLPGDHADEWAAQRVETDFYSPLDAAAAAVLSEMVRTGKPPSTDQGRTDWTRFIVSLFHRTPQHLDATLAKLTELNAELMPEVEQKYAALRGPNDPPTFAEWEAARAPFALQNSRARSVMDMTANPSLGPLFVNMEWMVIDTSSADYDLLTSDNPVILVPIKLPDGQIALPLGPRQLFFASVQERLIKAVKAASPKEIVRSTNRLVVERAEKLVIARSLSQASFIKKHFGTCRIGSLATGFHQPER